MTKLSFEENQSFGYRDRTIKNASADVTIAFAIDFNTAGEKLTKNSVENQQKIYIPINTSSLSVSPSVILSTIELINSVKTKTISINIAGNGIYTLIKRGYKYTQSNIDEFVFNFLNEIIKSSNLKKIVVLIRSGGQTGFDEAGIKSGIKLNIPTLVHAPKGWIFRNESGVDISNEELFKKRFII